MGRKKRLFLYSLSSLDREKKGGKYFLPQLVLFLLLKLTIIKKKGRRKRSRCNVPKMFLRVGSFGVYKCPRSSTKMHHPWEAVKSMILGHISFLCASWLAITVPLA